MKKMLVFIALLLFIILLYNCCGENIMRSTERKSVSSFQGQKEKSTKVLKVIPANTETETEPGMESIEEPTDIPSDKTGTVPVKGSKPAKQVHSVALPNKTEAEAPSVQINVTAMQEEMLDYINAERSNHNLNPLVLDIRLCEGANLKSSDMAMNDYFDHKSPAYGNAFEMMSGLGITYKKAAENIARNTSIKEANSAFISSEGHRANILDPDYNKAGLGFYQEGKDLYVTQWFTD